MNRWSARQLICLFLVVVFTGAMSLSHIQASAMTAKMATVSDMVAVGHDNCRGCPAGGDGMKATACSLVCVAPLLAVLPHAAPAMLAGKGVLVTARRPLLQGRTLLPDPHPPRATIS